MSLLDIDPLASGWDTKIKSGTSTTTENDNPQVHPTMGLRALNTKGMLPPRNAPTAPKTAGISGWRLQFSLSELVRKQCLELSLIHI